MADIDTRRTTHTTRLMDADSLQDGEFVLNGLLGGAQTANLLDVNDTLTHSPNGLLGSDVANTYGEFNINLPHSSPSEKSPVRMFVANGLLGGGVSTLDEYMSEFSSNGPLGGFASKGFIPNGLLGPTTNLELPAELVSEDLSATQKAAEQVSVEVGTADDAETSASGEFVSNGLLGTPDNIPFTLAAGREEALEVSESQDDLPTFSQLLKQYGLGSGASSATPGAFVISAKTYEGKTVTLRKRRKVLKTATSILEGRQTSKLLEIPIHTLKEHLSENLAESLTAATSVRAPLASASDSSKPADADLWVDRYRPKRFTDLLGDERVHRETMSWLKEWDICVFKKKKPKAKKTTQGDGNNGEYQYQDPFHRPREKILLLSGPAGLGKTTLAHVAARHAGYDVLEINASDARSGQVIEDRIQPALESGSAIGAKRPVCVIIDEIDGATGVGDNNSTFIHKLVGLTFGKLSKKSHSKRNDGAKGSRPLLRPIICICNDLYSSSLTKLRQHARIIRFNRPADIYITKRLRNICEIEGLKAESRALTTLVGLAKGDMRSCLNTLQFIKSKSTEVNESLVRSATTGMKEADSSFSTVLNSLFSPLPRRRAKELGLNEEAERRYVGRLSADLDACGTLEKVAVGCFEHYTKLRHFEATLERHEKAADWLLHYDLFSGTMRSEREYALLPYLSYNFVPFYHLFHERGGEKVERPVADWESFVKTKANEEVLKSLARCVQSAAGSHSVGLRHLLSNQILHLEFIPYINRIISPPLRPVNSQINKPSERALLARLVEIMASLELRFVQDKTEDGQLVYLLDPPVDIFITYDGKRAPDIAVPRYAIRHLVAAEIDAQLIARQAEATEKGKTTKASIFKSARQSDPEAREYDDDSQVDAGTLLAPLAPNGGHSAKKRKAEHLDPADKPPVDFFGRPIVMTSKRQATDAKQVIVKPYKVSYRFKEGNSAAVRKPVKVSSFL